MTLQGWIFMIASVSFVVALTGWCYWQVLRDPGASRGDGYDG